MMLDHECSVENWHGWPPQVWDGKCWKPIKQAELAVKQANEIERLKEIINQRSGADG